MRYPVLIIILLLFNCLSASGSANAMTFKVEDFNGEPAIVGEGEIIEGDGKRLEAVLSKDSLHSLGYYALALNSPGGSVTEAFRLSEIINKYNKINTYVLPGAECVGACASIVFIAGEEHVVAPGGKLGFYECYNNLTNCNEDVAQHAVSNGTAYGSIMATIKDVPRDEIKWFSKEGADCWAINRYTITPEPNNYEQCVFGMINNIEAPLTQTGQPAQAEPVTTGIENDSQRLEAAPFEQVSTDPDIQDWINSYFTAAHICHDATGPTELLTMELSLPLSFDWDRLVNQPTRLEGRKVFNSVGTLEQRKKYCTGRFLELEIDKRKLAR